MAVIDAYVRPWNDCFMVMISVLPSFREEPYFLTSLIAPSLASVPLLQKKTFSMELSLASRVAAVTYTGFDAALVEKVIRMVNMNEHKRFQTAPILRVSSKAFGQGRRMPLVAKY